MDSDPFNVPAPSGFTASGEENLIEFPCDSTFNWLEFTEFWMSVKYEFHSHDEILTKPWS